MAAKFTRKQHMKASPQERLQNLQGQTAHLTAIALANTPEEEKMHKASLKAASPRLHGAIDTLMEVARHEAPAGSQIKAQLHDYAKKSDAEARKFISGEGFPTVKALCQSHVDATLKPHGGSFLDIFKKANPVAGATMGAMGMGLGSSFSHALSHVFARPNSRGAAMGHGFSLGSITKPIGQVAGAVAPLLPLLAML